MESTNAYIEHQGTKYYLVQQAYLDTDCYRASAESADGVMAEVRWAILDSSYDDNGALCIDDESDACDWDRFEVEVI